MAQTISEDINVSILFLAVDRFQPVADELDNDRDAGVLPRDPSGRVSLGPGRVEHGGAALHHRGVPTYHPWCVSSVYSGVLQ